MNKNNKANKIISLKVKNVFSFYDETKISFLGKTRKKDKRSFYQFINKKEQVNISNINGVFGINSSGKTNLIIKTIQKLKKIIKSKNVEKELLDVPFFNSKSKESAIALEFLTSAKFYYFEIKFKNNKITYEKLSFKEKKANKYQNIYKVENNQFYLKNKLISKIELKDETIIGNTSLFNMLLYKENIKISTKRKHIELVKHFFTTKIHLLTPEALCLEEALSKLANNSYVFKKFNNIAKEVNLGFEKIECKLNEVVTKNFQMKQKDNGFFFFLAKDKVVQKTSPKFYRSIDIDKYELVPNLANTLSSGTIQFIETIIFLLDAIQNNHVLIWDEFGSLLDDELIDAIFEIIANNDSVQLIFNSNKKSIISKLDWNQIFIVKLNRHWESSLVERNYSRIQQVEIEKKYRNNYFGNLNNFNVISILKHFDKAFG